MTVTLSVMAWLLTSGVSTLHSAHPLQSVIRGAWTPLILAGCLLYVLASDRLSPWVRPALTGLLLILCAGSLWQAHTGWHLEAGRLWRAHGFLPHPNDTALAAVMAPVLAPWTWPFAAGLILLSGSRTALVGLGIALFVLARNWMQRVILAALAVFALVAFVHAAAITSLTSRLGAWAVAWRMFREHPWLGMGPQTFVDHYLAWLPAALPFGGEPAVAFIPWAHSLYFEIGAERGFPGLAVIVVLSSLAWHTASRPLRAALAAFLVMGLVDLTFLKPWVVGAYWGLVTLALTGWHPTPFTTFRVIDYPWGWTWTDDEVERKNGLGVKLGAWTYFLVWGPGPYLL